MKTYIGTKTINAKPMTRGEYTALRGWSVPENENPNDAGYLVEYPDSQPGNHPDFVGYISWSPAEVFQNSYKLAETFLDRLTIEYAELDTKISKLTAFINSSASLTLAHEQYLLLASQSRHMKAYADILESRIRLINADNQAKA